MKNKADINMLNQKKILNQYHVIVGVMTQKIENKVYPFPRGKQERIYKEMQLEAEKDGIYMYFFYPEYLFLEKNIIQGHRYIKNRSSNKWVVKKEVMPNVVYNRILYRTYENKSIIQRKLKKLIEHPEIHFFNTRFLNKWEVYDALKNKINCLPETYIYNRKNTELLLSKYDELFLKPISNSAGKGIVKLIREKKYYLLLRAEDKKNKWLLLKSCDEILNVLDKKIIKKSKYIIQRGIYLAQYEGRLFDIRCQVQKNAKGMWVFTGGGVRSAAPGKFVTHVPNGGKILPYQDTIQKVFPNTYEIIDKTIKDLCLSIPLILEEELKLHLGIVSLDIAVDHEGNTWLLEVNSKPASFDENLIRKKHLSYLNDYFKYLAKIH